MPARPGMRPAAFGLGSGLICEHLNGQEQGGGLYRGPLTCPPSSYGSVPSCKGWGQGGNGSGSLSLYCVTLFSPITSQSFLLFHLRAWWGSLPRKMSWLLAVLGGFRGKQTQVEICSWEVYWAVLLDSACERSRSRWKGMPNPDALQGRPP